LALDSAAPLPEPDRAVVLPHPDFEAVVPFTAVKAGNCWVVVVLSLVACGRSALLGQGGAPKDGIERVDSRSRLRLVPQLGHGEVVLAMATVPRRNLLATGGRDGVVGLWDLSAGVQVAALECGGGEVSRLAFTDDESRLIVGTNKGLVSSFDVETQSLLWRADLKRGGVLALHAGPQRTLVVLEQGVVALANQSGTTLETLPLVPKGQPAFSADISSDGALLEIALDKPARLEEWDLATRTRKRTRTDLAGEVRISRDSRHVAVSAGRGNVLLWDRRTDKTVRTTSEGDCSALSFSHDSKLLAVGCDALFEVFATFDGAIFGRHEDGTIRTVFSTAFSPDGRGVIAAFNDHIRVVDLATDTLALEWTGRQSAKVQDTLATPSGDRFVISHYDGVSVFSVRDLRLLSGVHRSNDNITYGAPALSADGRTVLAVELTLGEWFDKNKATRTLIWQADTGRRLLSIPGVGATGSNVVTDLSADGTIGVVAATDHYPTPVSTLSLIDVRNGVVSVTRRLDGVEAWFVRLLADGRRVALGTARGLAVVDLRAPLEALPQPSTRRMIVTALDVSPNGLDIAWTSTASNEIEIFHLPTGARRPLRGHDSPVVGLAFAGPNQLRSVDASGLVVTWNVVTGSAVSRQPTRTPLRLPAAMLLGGTHLVAPDGVQNGAWQLVEIASGKGLTLLIGGGDWIAYTASGYFDGSRGASGLLAGARGSRGFLLDQLAIERNRPDLVLGHVNLGTGELLDHYRWRHQRRLRKLGLDPGRERDRFDEAPTVEIVNTWQDGGQLLLEVQATSSKTPLARVHVTVNGVPSNGLAGLPLSGTVYRSRLNVPLGEGLNRVEVSVHDAMGRESLRAVRLASGSSRVAGTLHFLGLGVSRHPFPELNLRYADSDARQMGARFASMRAAYAAAKIEVLVDQQVTRQAIAAARAALTGAAVDDTLVVFVAGHGIYSPKSGQYHFVTYDADPRRLEETAASYEDLESLLDASPARHKLLMLDTCESGDSDEAPLAPEAAPNATRLQVRGLRLTHLGNTRRPQVLSPDLGRLIEGDLFRRTGAVVISSSLGTEPSFEDDGLAAGVFSSAVQRALAGDADVNNDGLVSSNELSSFVSRIVASYTGDRQHPSMERHNSWVSVDLPVSGRGTSRLTPARSSEQQPPARSGSVKQVLLKRLDDLAGKWMALKDSAGAREDDASFYWAKACYRWLLMVHLAVEGLPEPDPAGEKAFLDRALRLTKEVEPDPDYDDPVRARNEVEEAIRYLRSLK